jgi:monoamine oxidase
MKSVKSMSLRLIQKAFGQLNRQRMPRMVESTDPSRRQFIKTTMRASLLIGVAPNRLDNPLNDKQKKVIIIGAGLAGLTAAWFLQKAGTPCLIYEGSPRVGGRTLSIRDTFGKGTAVDLGGEFVDEWHDDLRKLINELDLETYDLRNDPDYDKKNCVYFKNQIITEQMLVNALLPYAISIQTDLDKIPQSISYKNLGAALPFDNISIADYFKEKGIDGWLYEYLCNAFTHEYGLEASEQSALNMLTVFKLPSKNARSIEIIGGDGSEVFKIKGGAMSVCERIAQKITSPIHLNEALIKIELLPNLRYRLTFDSKKVEETDYVVMAIPFTKLREIELNIPLSTQKKQAIQELGYGNSSKLVLGFKKPIWAKKGYNGFIYSDLAFANTGWNTTPLQKTNKKESAWTLFTGGNATNKLTTGDLAANTQSCLESLQILLPGIKKKWNKKSLFWHWEQYEWAKAGYSTWKIGQWKAFAGVEGEREGRVFFCGEHCSVQWQGFMNGAVETGRLSAEEILSD